jgi:hypothetical protein
VAFKLPYGLCEEELVTIDTVKAGLACNCFCPCCNKQLIAKKGRRKVHHFAHYNSPECAGGIETPLHRMCKDIFLYKKEFTIPAYISSKGKKMAEAITIQIDNVYLEKRLDTIVPDIILECKGKQLLVEIEVTHPVDEVKLKKIRRKGFAVVCVDARKLVKELFDKGDYLLKNETFQNALVYGVECKRWLHNPKYKQIERKQAKESAARRQQLFLEKNYISKPKGTLKEFKAFRKRTGFDLFYVEDCPIEMRTWKSGPSSGKHYASADDCRSCRFCHKLEQRAHPHTGFIKHLFPNKVDCTGTVSLQPDKNKYVFKGKGPKAYYSAVGRFMVIDEKNERKFFHEFHKAYHFYLQRGSASVINAQTGELIEQKILKPHIYHKVI